MGILHPFENASFLGMIFTIKSFWSDMRKTNVLDVSINGIWNKDNGWKVMDMHERGSMSLLFIFFFLKKNNFTQFGWRTKWT